MLNSVVLMGRITKDLEVKEYGETKVLSFTIAINRKFAKEGEEKQADFIMCKCFNKTAENLARFFRKGSLIAVEGRIQTGSYDKEGVKVYTTDVIVEGWHFTGEKKDTNEQSSGFEYIDNTATNDDELPF